MAPLTWGSEAGSGLAGPPMGACPSLPAPSAGGASSAPVKETVREAVIPSKTLLAFHFPPSRSWGTGKGVVNKQMSPGSLHIGRVTLLKGRLKPEALWKGARGQEVTYCLPVFGPNK